MSDDQDYLAECVNEERERCARIAEEQCNEAHQKAYGMKYSWILACREIARLIRGEDELRVD